jgi:hypothetical protein
VEVLAESFIERYRRGERPEISEYTERHPELAEKIQELFPALLMVERLGSEEAREGGGKKGSGDEIGKCPGEMVGEGRGKGLGKRLGDYTIVREIGGGGMGVVYEARQESLGRRVALKVLPYHSLLSEGHLERFRREAQAAARLHHTNIVPVYGVGEEEGVHYYAMQLIVGQSLDKVIEELRRLRVAALQSACGAGKSTARNRGKRRRSRPQHRRRPDPRPLPPRRPS